MAQRPTAPTANVAASASEATPPRVRRFRWWPAAVIIVLGLIGALTGRILFAEEWTHQVFFLLGVFSFWTLFLPLWWLFASGLTWRQKGLGVLIVAVLLGLFSQLVRMEGFTGAMVPKLAWRWSPTPQERLTRFQEQQRLRQTAAPAPSAVAQNDTAAAGGSDSASKPGTNTTTTQTDGTAALTAANATASASEQSSAGTMRPEFMLTAGDSAEFRGPQRDGIVDGTGLKFTWTDSDRPPQLWQIVVGAGWSGFSVVGNRCYTQEQRGEEEAVVCYDLQTGRQIWEHRDAAKFGPPPSGIGPRATPTVSNGYVYTVGATGIANCLDWWTGKKIWSEKLLDDPVTQSLEWGHSTSPLLLDDQVIYVAGRGGPKHGDRHSLRVHHAGTGRLLWTANPSSGSYCSPQIAELGGVRQLLVFDAAGLKGFDLSQGQELWSFPWTNGPQINVAQPVVLDAESVLIGTGYATGSARLQIRREGDQWTAKSVWTTKKMKPKFNGMVRLGDAVYGLDDGVLACLDLSTGKQLWKAGRYGFGQLLLAGQTLIVLTEAGEVVCLDASPQAAKEIGRFQAISGITWNQLQLVRGLLLVRSNEEAACYDLRAASAPGT